VLAVGAALAVVAGPIAAQDPAGPTFVLTNLSDPDPIDPAAYTHTMARTLVRNVYDPLVYYKLGTTELEPYLATEWSVSDDGLVYTFTLREGVTFHGGQPFTADDVKASFDRAKEINLTPATYLQDVSETRVVDPYTVEVELSRPYQFFLGQLPKVPITSAADITEHAGDDNAQTWFKDNANGTGPYALDSYVRGEQYTLVRNESYWGSHPDGSIARVIVQPIGDSATQRQLIEAGDVHMGSWMAFRDMVEAANADGVALCDFPSPMTMIGALNGGRPPLDNVLVRQALLAAFPYDRMAEFYQGYAQIPRHVLSPSYPGSDQSYPELTQDLERAAELLTEAGFEGGGGMQLRYVAVQGLEDERQAGLLLQDALAQLGVTLTIDTMPFSTYFEQQQSVETAPDIGPGYEAPETDDPFQWFAKLFATDGFLNWGHFGDPALDAVIDDAQVEPDATAREEQLREAQKIINDNVFALPMSNFNALYACSEKVHNFVHDITDLIAVPKFHNMTMDE
jgi:peptide/nickel transport system substrate-binding protein